jgi:fumarate reductase subunit D
MGRYSGTRTHPSYWAFVLHRISGVLLSLFLPLHFWVLSLALEGEARLESFIRWTDDPVVKVLETGIVMLLAAHLAGGLRLLAMELLPWRGWYKAMVSLVAGVSVAVGVLFLLN